MSIEDLNADLAERLDRVHQMGGDRKLRARSDAGLLNARERIASLADPDSYRELGAFAGSGGDAKSDIPADGKVTGFCRVDGRSVGVVSNDFTVKGASSTPINGQKISRVKEIATAEGLPVVFLGESTGARMPDIMGAGSMGAGRNPTQYLRDRATPWVGAVLGPCFGSATWYSVLSDVTIMRKGAHLAVGSPRLTALATGEESDVEEMGGWEIHATRTGLVDLVVDTDHEAVEMVKTVLSYLPSHCDEAPPVVPYSADEQREEERAALIEKIVPVSRTRGYDMRKVIRRVADEGSVLELKALFGRSMTTSLARIAGRTVGFVANNPMFKGGAIDAEGCSKATGFIALCDSFNIPLVFVSDQPGFMIGIDGERKLMPGRIMNWMNAISLATVPKIALVARKSYGQAVLNMGLGGNADEACAWTTAEIGFMDPSHGATIVYGLTPENDPEGFEQARAEMAKETSPYAAAAVNSVQDVIRPRDTRDYLIRALETHRLRRSGGVGQGRMRTWPTTVI